MSKKKSVNFVIQFIIKGAFYFDFSRILLTLLHEWWEEETF